MTIKRAFRSVLIQKPGSYSFSEVRQNGSTASTVQGVLFLVGEAAEGAPGSSDGIRTWDAAQLNSLIDYYGSGPLVDAALAAVAGPSPDPGVGGATQVLTYQTNAATKAALELDNAAATAVMDIKDRKYGERGNLIAVEVLAGTTANQKVIKITRGTQTETLLENEAEIQISVQYTGGGSASDLTIGVVSGQKVLTVATTGGVAEDSFSITLKDDLIMQELADQINGKANFTASASTSARFRSSSDLDIITTAADILAGSVDLLRAQKEIEDRINESSAIVMAELKSNIEGVPATAAKTFLAGGARGISANSNFSAGFSKSLSKEYNVALPCISRDASEDITAGETDPSSTYTIAGVIAALGSHLSLRGSIKNRKEAQGMVGFRGANKAAVKAQAATIADFRIQLFCQDVLTLDSAANLVWKQPHIQAAKAAGIRLGTDIGEPMTFTFMRINGAEFRVDPDTGLSTGDFDPVIDFEEMIEAGVTFTEPSGAGHKIVVDNTTYGKDQSFVFNRGSVIEASFHIAKSIRQETENIFVGRKNSERVVAGQVSQGVAKSIREVVANKLKELHRDAITASSIDAPQGFVESSLSVSVEGNTARVSVEVKPVQGIDFILIEFSLGETRQIA